MGGGAAAFCEAVESGGRGAVPAAVRWRLDWVSFSLRRGIAARAARSRVAMAVRGRAEEEPRGGGS